jgi:hypothetical protein
MKPTFEEIEAELEKYQELYDKKFNEDNTDRSWQEFLEYAGPEIEKLGELSRAKRMIMPYKLSELSDFGDVMSLKHFIDCVKSGGFIDYDGFGRYVEDGKETNITILPSDVKHNAVRKGFDTIVWFNR